MVRVEFKSLSRRKAVPKVARKSIRTVAGKIITVRRLDADSDTFSDDFRYIFEKNVQSARRENRKLKRIVAKKKS